MTGGPSTSLPLRLPVAGAAGSVLSLDELELHWTRRDNSYVSLNAGQQGHELLYDTQMMYKTDEYLHSASQCVYPVLLNIPADQLTQTCVDRPDAPAPAQLAELSPPGSLPLSSLDLSDPVMIAAILDYCKEQDKLNAPVVKKPAQTHGPAGLVPPVNLAVPMTQKAIPGSPHQDTSDVIDTFYHFDSPPAMYQPASTPSAASSQPQLGVPAGFGPPASPATFSFGLVPPTPACAVRPLGPPTSTLASRTKGQAMAGASGSARARAAVAGVPPASSTHPSGSQRGHPYPRPSTASAHVTTGHAISGSHVNVAPQSVAYAYAYSPPESYSPPSSTGSSGTRERSVSRSISPPSATTRNPHAPVNALPHGNGQVFKPAPANASAAQQNHAQQPSQPLAPLVPTAPCFTFPSDDVVRMAHRCVAYLEAETDLDTKSRNLHWRTINVRMVRSRQRVFRNLGQWYDSYKDDGQKVALLLAINALGWLVDRHLVLGA